MKTISKAPTAYSYLRFSTVEQATGDSYRRQTHLAERYCKENGLTLDTKLSFKDLGVSAFKGRHAEVGKLGEFLKACEDGIVMTGDYFLLESLDRLSRQSARKALRLLEDIVEYGVTVVTLLDNKEYTTLSLDEDPTSLLMSILIFMRANEESRTKSVRVKQAILARRAEGRPMSFVPSWIEKTSDGGYKLIEERAKVIRSIFRMYVNDGLGLDSIAKKLTKDGVPTFGKSSSWHRSSVMKFLFTPSAIGHLESTVGHPLLENVYPAAVDTITYELAQEMRSSNGKSKQRSKTVVPSLLKSVGKCPACGGSIGRVKNSHGSSYYRCNQSRRLACENSALIPAKPIEEGIINNIHLLLADIPSSSDPQTDLRSQLEELKTHESVLDDQIQGVIEFLASSSSDKVYKTVANKLESMEIAKVELEENKRVLTQKLKAGDTTVVSVKIDRLAELMGLDEDSLEDTATRLSINAILRSCFSSITVDKDNKMMSFRWSHQDSQATSIPYGM